MAKLRDLFVDDESQVLDGIRRLPRGMRGEWDMTFATSALGALEAILERHGVYDPEAPPKPRDQQ